MTRYAPLLLLTVFTACDTSSFRDCAIACTAQTGCPDGLSCGTEGFCRIGATATSCNVVRDARDEEDADTSCVCSTTETLSCDSGQTTCALGCVADDVAHCRTVTPSNAVPLGPLDRLEAEIAIDGIATFDTDTGAITGAITRTPGTGIRDDIAFTTTGTIGVFTMHALSVSPFGEIRFTGSNAAAFVVETTATIDGDIDGSGGCYGSNRSCAGPGGGAGASATVAEGCGPGANGEPADISSDPGGGGGGSRRAGAAGGADPLSTGAAGGLACMSPMVEPLVGGSGGGIGALGSATAPGMGGGGGGALQLTALEKIVVNGVIDMGGAGGSGGPPGSGDRGGGGGSGGGAGGAVLLEAPTVIIAGIVVANGGAGGGPANNTTVGTDGADGTRTTTPAAGGMTQYGNGGNGGAGTTAPTAGTVASSVNGGGGGGGTGAIFVRTIDPPVLTGALLSPPIGSGALRIE